MKKNIPQRRKGINPAMIYMSEEAKAKTAIRAASEAVRLITLKILHDTTLLFAGMFGSFRIS